MNTNRLLKLADFLENNVTNEQFNLEFMWDKTPCGTVGCALGWVGICFGHDSDVQLLESSEVPGHFYIDNEEGFFDINHEEKCYLFYGDTEFGFSITRKQEIQLIRDFINNGGVPTSRSDSE